MSRTRPARAVSLRRSRSCSCSCRRRARGWWPGGHRAMPITPRRWPRGRRPSRGPPPTTEASRGRPSAWTSPAPGHRGRGGQCCWTVSAGWGVDVAVGSARSTGLVLARCLEAGRSMLRRLPHLPAFQRQVRAVSTMVTLLAPHGVAVAPATDRDLLGLETMVLRAMWGATSLSRAKEVVIVVMAPGHRISPVLHTHYERVLRIARIARTPGPRPGAGHLRERPPAPTNGAFRARPTCGLPVGLAPTRGLVVLGSAGPNGAAAPGAGAHGARPA